MAIRLVNATIWQRDWFLNLDGKHQLFVHYLRDHCDHAGVWQPSFKLFEKISGMRIFKDEFLSNVNQDSIRVHILENGKWWLTGFIEDQYKTLSLNSFNSAHRGVISQLENNQVPYESYGYKVAPSKPLASPFVGAKDKDKDKDNIELNLGENAKRGYDVFDQFWKSYPKKVGKGAAQKAWSKIKEPVGTIDLILGALCWQRGCEQWKKDNGQFIPNPATYLNQRRWEDEPVKGRTALDILREKGLIE